MRRKEPEVTFLTQEEVRKLFAVMKDRRDRALFRLAYHHGLRASEVGLLRRGDVDLKQARIYIQRVKDSWSREYPMEPEDVKMVRAYLRVRDDDSPYLFISNRMLPIHRQTLWDMMQRYGREAGLPKEKRKFHALRHSIAMHMLDGQADIAFVQDRLGHKNIQNTMVYARYSTTAREEQTRKVFSSHRVV